MSSQKTSNNLFYPFLWTSVAATTIGVGSLLLTRFKVCAANQIMVRTGFGIRDMLVSKKGIIYPFQQFQMINMNPRTHSFELHHMSSEKVPFNLPVVFTIAPTDPTNDVEQFKNFARKMTNISELEYDSTIRSVIHGETRILTADLTIEEMFSDRDKFKSMVSDHIQRDLNQFGLTICNANIEEMKDHEGNNYFSFLKQKAIEGANNQARVAVSEAKRIGDIGEQINVGQARQRKAEIEAETVQVENTRDRDIAESRKNLNVAKAEYYRLEETARIQAEMAAKIMEIDLQQQLEAKRVQQEMETTRAKDLVVARVTAESAIERAQGEAESIRRLAESHMYAEQRKAEGIKSIFEAQSLGISQLMQASGNNPHLVQFYLASTSGLYVELAGKTAQAVQGLKPKINIWNTGPESSHTDPFSSLRGLMTSLPPMLDVLQQQTNVPVFGGASKPK